MNQHAHSILGGGLGTQSPDQTVLGNATLPCQSALMQRVGAALGRFHRQELSPDELEQHIDDLGFLWRRAYDRFQSHGNPADRDEALLWLHQETEARMHRSQLAQAARWAEIDLAIDEGIDYFQVQGAKAHALIQQQRAAAP